MASRPTEEQIQVLMKARDYYGRSWRREILFAWYNGNYKGIDPDIASALQRIRNDYNRDWSISSVKL